MSTHEIIIPTDPDGILKAAMRLGRLFSYGFEVKEKAGRKITLHKPASRPTRKAGSGDASSDRRVEAERKRQILRDLVLQGITKPSELRRRSMLTTGEFSYLWPQVRQEMLVDGKVG